MTENLIWNGGFTEGWIDVPNLIGGHVDQQAVGYRIEHAPLSTFVASYQQVACDAQGDPEQVHEVVQSLAEMAHKHMDDLPPNERPGGPDELVLVPPYCYKVHSGGNPYSSSLSWQFAGLEIGRTIRAIVPIQAHHHGDGSCGACAVRVEFGAIVTPWLSFHDGIEDRTWLYITVDTIVPASGELNLKLVMDGRAEASISYFTDDWQAFYTDDPVEPPTPEPGQALFWFREDYRQRTFIYPQDATDTQKDQVEQAARPTNSTVTGSWDIACQHRKAYTQPDGTEVPPQECVIEAFFFPPEDRTPYLGFVREHYGGVVEEGGEVEIVWHGDNPEPPEPPGELVLTYPTTHLPAVITQGFHSGHLAIDLRSSYRAWGDEALAALDGEVIEAMDGHPIFGTQVLTRSQHGDDTIVLRYAHFIEGEYYVSVGDLVSEGEPIGKIGSTGQSSADHLHFSVKLNGVYVDPEPLIDWPSPPVEPPPGNEIWTDVLVGLHAQHMSGEGLESWTRNAKPGAVKVFSLGDGVLFDDWGEKQQKIIWRHYQGNDGAWLRNPDGSFKSSAGLLASAIRWLDAYSAELEVVARQWNVSVEWLLGKIDYLTSLNEVVSTNHPEIFPAVEFDCLLADEIKRRYGDLVHCGGLNIAVGNPGHDEFKFLLPYAQKCHEDGHACGQHCYWTAGDAPDANYVDKAFFNGEWHDMWPHLAGRWTEIDKVFVENGYYVNWYSGEIGGVYVYPDWPPWWVHSGKSWKSMRGGFPWYLEQIDLFNRKAVAWNKANGGRFFGGCLFTRPAWGWEEFTWDGGAQALLEAWAVNFS